MIFFFFLSYFVITHKSKNLRGTFNNIFNPWDIWDFFFTYRLIRKLQTLKKGCISSEFLSSSNQLIGSLIGKHTSFKPNKTTFGLWLCRFPCCDRSDSELDMSITQKVFQPTVRHVSTMVS